MSNMDNEKKYTEEDRDLFAMSFLTWYTCAEDAQIHKEQNLSTYKMLQLYKDRPYLRTDSPQSN